MARSVFGKVRLDWSSGTWTRPAPRRVGGEYFARAGWANPGRVVDALCYIGASPKEMADVMRYLFSPLAPGALQQAMAKRWR